jgi:hypothetical protein
VVAIACTLQFFSTLGADWFPEYRASMVGTTALCAGFWTEAMACFFLLRCACCGRKPKPVPADGNGGGAAEEKEGLLKARP